MTPLGGLRRLIGAASAAAALACGGHAQDGRPDPVLSQDMGARVVAVQDRLAAQDYGGALARLDLAAAASPSPYELAVILTLRGGAKRALGDISGAAADWRGALAGGALTEMQQLSVRRSLAQLEGGASD
jgi:hypothetical protein